MEFLEREWLSVCSVETEIAQKSPPPIYNIQSHSLNSALRAFFSDLFAPRYVFKPFRGEIMISDNVYVKSTMWQGRITGRAIDETHLVTV